MAKRKVDVKKLAKALKIIKIDLGHARRKVNALHSQFMTMAEGCEFNQPEGGDGPECCHTEMMEQDHYWCDPFECPLIK